jgi:hypothetical protein
MAITTNAELEHQNHTVGQKVGQKSKQHKNTHP